MGLKTWYKSKYSGYWILVISVMFGLTLPTLIQDGMFQDAMLYSSVSHNLGQGIGSFWFPQYSKLNIDGLSSFHEHPPLVFGIQSIFFKILGSSIYVERFYTFLMLCLNAFLISRIWKVAFAAKEGLKKLSFLPVLFWIAFPVCFWSFSNNMQENTLSAFALASVWVMLKGARAGVIKPWSWLIGGVLIVAASMCKGIPGFFPIVFPFIYWITHREGSFLKMIIQSLILLATISVVYLILFSFPESRESLSTYLFDRALKRIDAVPTAAYRMEIMWRLFTESLPLLILLVLAFVLGKVKKEKFNLDEVKGIMFFFCLMGLSASIPLTFTMVQKGFYLVPSFPYFALGLSALAAPVIRNLFRRNESKKEFNGVKIAGIILFVAVIIFTGSQYGKVSRERDTISDVYTIGEVVPKFSDVTVPEDMYDEFDFIFHGFLMRYCNISLDPNESHPYLVTERSMNYPIPDNYEKVDLPTKTYDLYKRVNK
jgi:hypothetical protein